MTPHVPCFYVILIYSFLHISSFTLISAFYLLLFSHSVFVSSLLSVSTPLLSPFLSVTEIILSKCYMLKKEDHIAWN